MASFQMLKRKQPERGDILVSLTGNPVTLTEERREEKGQEKKGIFCRAVASLEKNGWYLADQGIGLVCFIMPDSQKKLVRNAAGKFTVEALRVVRYVPNGRAILMEVVETETKTEV